MKNFNDKWMRLGTGLYCREEIAETLFAETTKADLEAIAAIAQRMLGTSENALSEEHPNVKRLSAPVRGHKGTNNSLQLIVVQRGDGKSFIVLVRDNAKCEPIEELDDLPEADAELLRQIASAVSV